MHSIAARVFGTLYTLRHGVTKVHVAGELLSSIVLLEAAVKAQEQVLGFRDPSISAASRKAENLLSALSGQERQQVAALGCVCCPLMVARARAYAQRAALSQHTCPELDWSGFRCSVGAWASTALQAKPVA